MFDLEIAKPCDQSWTAMKGDETVRHCQRCDHHVYNIAQMTEREVEALIRRTEGRFCARIYRRTDNRVMTADCPRGVARVRRQKIALVATMAFATTLVAGPLFAPVYGTVRVKRTRSTAPVKEPPMTEDVAAPKPPEFVGEVAPSAFIGKIAIIEKRK